MYDGTVSPYGFAIREQARTGRTWAIGLPRPPGSDVALDDVTYRVHATGESSPTALLFLHGSGPGATGTSNWNAVIEELGERYYCLAPDMIGFGDSEHPENPPSGMKAFNLLQADTLWQLLDTLGVDRVHLVGNSMGGMISIRMALSQPERVETMLLMGSGGAPDLPITPGLQHLRTFYADPTPESLRALLESFVHDMGTLTGVVDRVVAERSHAAMFDPKAGPPAFTDEELTSLPHRTLCVHGRDDIIVPVESSTYLARTMPNATLHIIPKCGHWTQIEAHDTFVFLLESLLAGRL
ncbi:alpha/beta fold hydrolase [Intrasporangium calvum]|uniref:alpha/beta fold hydrolase n=1 Tax=Intrasporangium calvum TaxID=53358 RepID=UPI001F270083|nr:alpha/beta hydrolase [Intrasporangium calvum]